MQMGNKNQNLQLRIIISLLGNIERYRVEFVRRIDQFFVTKHYRSSVRSDRVDQAVTIQIDLEPAASCQSRTKRRQPWTGMDRNTSSVKLTKAAVAGFRSPDSCGAKPADNCAEIQLRLWSRCAMMRAVILPTAYRVSIPLRNRPNSGASATNPGEQP